MEMPPPPLRTNSARGDRWYRMISFYCTLWKLRIAKYVSSIICQIGLDGNLSKYDSHVFCVSYCLFEIFYQECHNLILASNINVRSNYESTFSWTQIDSCLMILEPTVAVCRGQETAS